MLVVCRMCVMERKKKRAMNIQPSWKNGWTGGSMKEEDKHVLPIPFTLRPCSQPLLVPYFG